MLDSVQARECQSTVMVAQPRTQKALFPALVPTNPTKQALLLDTRLQPEPSWFEEQRERSEIADQFEEIDIYCPMGSFTQAGRV